MRLGNSTDKFHLRPCKACKLKLHKLLHNCEQLTNVLMALSGKQSSSCHIEIGIGKAKKRIIVVPDNGVEVTLISQKLMRKWNAKPIEFTNLSLQGIGILYGNVPKYRIKINGFETCLWLRCTAKD